MAKAPPKKATSSVFQDRVRKRVEALGGQPTVIAEKAGLQRNFIYDITERGTKSGIRVANMDRLAKALECDPKYLMGDIDTLYPEEQAAGVPQATGLPFGGICWPGAWFGIPTRQEPNVPLAPDPRYPGMPQKAYRVEGITVLGSARDVYVVGIDTAEFGPVATGSLVVARRTRQTSDGEEAQLSVRRVDYAGDQTRLDDVMGTRGALTLESPPAGETLTIVAVITLGVQML